MPSRIRGGNLTSRQPVRARSKIISIPGTPLRAWVYEICNSLSRLPRANLICTRISWSINESSEYSTLEGGEEEEEGIVKWPSLLLVSGVTFEIQLIMEPWRNLSSGRRGRTARGKSCKCGWKYSRGKSQGFALSGLWFFEFVPFVYFPPFLLIDRFAPFVQILFVRLERFSSYTCEFIPSYMRSWSFYRLFFAVFILFKFFSDSNVASSKINSFNFWYAMELNPYFISNCFFFLFFFFFLF